LVVGPGHFDRSPATAGRSGEISGGAISEDARGYLIGFFILKKVAEVEEQTLIFCQKNLPQ